MESHLEPPVPPSDRVVPSPLGQWPPGSRECAPLGIRRARRKGGREIESNNFLKKGGREGIVACGTPQSKRQTSIRPSEQGERHDSRRRRKALESASKDTAAVSAPAAAR